jgi:hypothetical protein
LDPACLTPSAPAPRAFGISDVTGLWEGAAVNGCGFVQMVRTRCHAVVNIALTMTQQGSTVGGSYKCGMGTMM